MPYITSVEQIGIRKGLEQGILEGRQSDIICILEVRFENIPPKLREIISKIEDLEILENLLVQAVTLQSVEGFQSVASQYIIDEDNFETSP